MSIDWQAQWKLHAFNFEEGELRLDLTPYGFPPLVRLKPGPGFGDLSHQTTRLVLKAMPAYVPNQPVLDIGAGSGILSFAALGMQASSVIGLEIEPDALLHAKENAHLNARHENVQFLPPNLYKPGDEPMVVLMNMIRSEQKVAWKSLPKINYTKILTSGVLKEERIIYLEQAKAWGWALEKEWELDGWLAFCFHQDHAYPVF